MKDKRYTLSDVILAVILVFVASYGGAYTAVYVQQKRAEIAMQNALERVDDLTNEEVKSNADLPSGYDMEAAEKLPTDDFLKFLDKCVPALTQ